MPDGGSVEGVLVYACGHRAVITAPRLLSSLVEALIHLAAGSLCPSCRAAENAKVMLEVTEARLRHHLDHGRVIGVGCS